MGRSYGKMGGGKWGDGEVEYGEFRKEGGSIGKDRRGEGR